MRPLPVQRPRVPIWVAGVAPNRRPLERARRWDGYVPIGRGLAPDELAAYVGEHPRPGWDLVVPWADGVPADEYADAGVTWLVQSAWPKDDGWVRELQDLAATGPTSVADLRSGTWTSSGTPRARRGCSTPSCRTRRPWWRSCPAASGCTRRSPSAT